MKNPRYKKVLGIAVGERSLMIAEIATGVSRPSVSRLAEMPFPDTTTAADPARIGASLAEFLRTQLIAARAAVIGLPARWIVAQPKDVPVVDELTLSNILRLQAEAEFSTELKDLVYDYAGGMHSDSGGAQSEAAPSNNGETSTQSILLTATPRRYLDFANTIASAAKLNLLGVTASALALGEMSAGSGRADSLVLATGSVGGEMTAQRGITPAAIRHLRAASPEGPFVSELRRIVSTMPAASRREMLLWDDTGINIRTMSEQIGVPVRSGDLPMLGVDTDLASSNGQGRKFAAAVALALAGLSSEPLAVDFAHSRLAPPKERLVPLWIIGAAAAVLLLAGGIFWAFHSLSVAQAEVDSMQAQVDRTKPQVADATAFVDKVSFAQAWHGGDPRYLAAVRDLTEAMGDDPDTYATGLTLREAPRSTNPNSVTSTAVKTPDINLLSGLLSGRTTDQEHVQTLLDKMRKNKAFSEPKLGGSDIGRAREVNFTITFSYGLGDDTSMPSNPAKAARK